MTRSRAFVHLLFAVLASGVEFVSACSPTSAHAARVPDGEREIAELHKARCGNCHVRVEPGTRTREYLEAAFTRHRARVHLTEGDWAKMVDYLATLPGGGGQ